MSEGKPDSEPKPAESTHFRGSYLCRNCGLQHKYHGQWGECPTEAPSEAVERVQPEPTTTNQAYNGNPLYKAEPASVEPQVEPTRTTTMTENQRIASVVFLLTGRDIMPQLEAYDSQKCIACGGVRDEHPVTRPIGDSEETVCPKFFTSKEDVANEVAADSVSHPPLEQHEPAEPDGYAYRYPDGFIRHTNGEPINGSQPIESIPYFYGAVAAPSGESLPREGHCEDCDRDYPTPWFVGNEIWNFIVPPTVHFLCMHCFVIRAKKAGWMCTGWEIVPENPQTSLAGTELEQEAGELAVEILKNCAAYYAVPNQFYTTNPQAMIDNSINIAKGLIVAFCRERERKAR